MSDPKSLMQWIVESIDEELREPKELSGRAIYMRGYERWELDGFQRAMKQRRRELEAALPLWHPYERDSL